MGAYQHDLSNPPVVGGRRNPLPPDDTCRCAAIQVSPRFLRPLVRRALGADRVPQISEKDLHPEVDRVVSALLSLQQTVAESRARNGTAVRIAFTGPRRDGDDFRSELSVRLDQEEVFRGTLGLSGVWRRGKVSFAHAVIGAVELLYLHLPELASRHGTEVDLRIGVIELVGTAANLETVNRMTADEIAGAIAQKKNDGGGPTCQPSGPFDPLAMFGAFPSSGYGYFHGPSGELREEPLRK